MTLLVVHTAATWFMVGIIWMTQIVHYPLFSRVGVDAFTAYEGAHTRRMGALLAIPALTEVVTAAALAFWVPDGTTRALVIVAGALLATTWVMTAIVHAPLHRRLTSSFDAGLIDRLVTANWWRTAAWSIRGVLVATML